MTIQSIIIFLGILFGLVVIHEFGHFILAKFFKMRVDEFAFGFPPNIFKRKVGETTYSLNLIPLGGYVKIFGENGLDEEELNKLTADEKNRLFGSKPWWQRIIVLCGGVAFNIFGAIVLFTVAFMMGSNLFLDQNEIKTTPFASRQLILQELNEKSPLIGTEIALGDAITSMQADGALLTGENLNSYSASDFIQSHNNSNIQIFYKDANSYTKSLYVTPKSGIVDGKKILGAKFADTTFRKYGFIESLNHAIDSAFQQIIFIFTSLWSLLNDLIFKHAKVEDNLSGPIGLAVMTSKVAHQGLDQILIFAALLSLSLAVFNILPIPALDGGRILFVFIEIVSRKKVKASTEQIFHGLGFLALLCLMVFVTYFDIVKALT